MLLKKKAFYTAIVSIFAFATLYASVPATAAIDSYINIDDSMTVNTGTGNISQGGGVINFRNWSSGGSLSGRQPSADGLTYGQFEWTQTKMSEYSDNIMPVTPQVFSAKGAQKCTVVEVKFKVRLSNYSINPSPKVAVSAVAYTTDTNPRSTAISFDLGLPQWTPTQADQDTWKTIKYVFNPVTCLTSFYLDGNKVGSDKSSPTLAINDITEFRLYPRAYPVAGPDGKYPGGETTATDKVTPLNTPVIWTFDYFKVYQITPYALSGSVPADNQTGVDPSQPISLSFDTEMNTSTLNSDNIKLQLIDGDTNPEMPVSVAVTRPNACLVQPASLLEYFSTYNLTLLSGVKDQYGFYQPNQPKISFTTAPYPFPTEIQFDPASIVLKKDGQAVDSLTGGNISADIPLKNMTAEDKALKVVIALYTKDAKSGLNRFENQVAKNITLESGKEIVVSTDALQVPNDTSCFIKLYVWGGQNENYPVTDAIVCNMGGKPAITH